MLHPDIVGLRKFRNKDKTKSTRKQAPSVFQWSLLDDNKLHNNKHEEGKHKHLLVEVEEDMYLSGPPLQYGYSANEQNEGTTTVSSDVDMDSLFGKSSSQVVDEQKQQQQPYIRPPLSIEPTTSQSVQILKRLLNHPVNTLWAGTLSSTDLARGTRWLHCLADAITPYFEPGLYTSLLVPEKQDTNIHAHACRMDAPRTLPSHALFQRDGVGCEALARLLQAYSVYDPACGYSQGLSFVLATLMRHIACETAVFWCFVAIMKSSKYHLRALYVHNEGLIRACHELDNLLASYHPALYKHLTQFRLDATQYATSWFLTVFGYQCSSALTVDAFEGFLEDGIPSIYEMSLVVLDTRAKAILACDSFEKVFLLLVHVNDITIEHVMNTARRVKVKPLPPRAVTSSTSPPKRVNNGKRVKKRP